MANVRNQWHPVATHNIKATMQYCPHVPGQVSLNQWLEQIKATIKVTTDAKKAAALLLSHSWTGAQGGVAGSE